MLQRNGNWLVAMFIMTQPLMVESLFLKCKYQVSMLKFEEQLRCCAHSAKRFSEEVAHVYLTLILSQNNSRVISIVNKPCFINIWFLDSLIWDRDNILILLFHIVATNTHLWVTHQQGERILNDNRGSIFGVQGHDQIYGRIIFALLCMSLEQFQELLHLWLPANTVLLIMAGNKLEIIDVFRIGV